MTQSRRAADVINIQPLYNIRNQTDSVTKLPAWLRPFRKLFILFFLVVIPPAATLIGLGLVLPEQDRKLAQQRQSEILEHAADIGVRALEQDLATLARRLSGPSWRPEDVPLDSVYVVLSPDRIQAIPPGRRPYYPAGPALAEPAAEPFRELETQEFRERNLAAMKRRKHKELREPASAWRW